MTSYELSNIILELRTQLDDGLIDIETFNDTVEGLGVDDKVNGLIYANKRIDKEIELLKDERARLDKEIKKQETNKDRLKGLIDLLLKTSGAKKFEGVAGKVSYRKSKKLEVAPGFAETHKSEAYVIEDTSYKVDKKLLKEIIEAYGPIEGAIIVENNNIQIR